jgi:hypothetical protein
LEWVYNEGDLSRARVIFVHDFGDDRNVELMHHYAARSVWLFQVGPPKNQLIPYTPALR